MSSPLLVLLCGLSFAGKSTVAAGLVERLDGTTLSLDDINRERGLDGGQGMTGEQWATTNDLAHARVPDLLADTGTVVVDDTGSPRFIRDRWRETAASAGAVFALVWVQIDPADQRARVEKNRADGKRNDVVDQVLADHAAAFEDPTPDERPLVVDATTTRDAGVLDRLAEAITARGAGPRTR